MDKAAPPKPRRTTHHIRRKPASNIHHAIRIAEALGTPLNTFVTLNFSLTECSEEKVSEAFGRLRNGFFSPWVRRPSRRARTAPSKPAYVWVIEAAGETVALHWLLHLPADRQRDFAGRLPGWFEKVTGGVHAPHAIDSQRARNAKGLGRYFLKGMEEMYAPYYGVRFEAQGIVHGKRAGISQNLGPKAKKELREAGQYPPAKPFGVGMGHMGARKSPKAPAPAKPRPGPS